MLTGMVVGMTNIARWTLIEESSTILKVIFDIRNEADKLRVRNSVRGEALAIVDEQGFPVCSKFTRND
jgi:hypothetical protein